MTDHKKIKVALIGYGHLGKWHAQKCEKLEHSDLFAIVESHEEGQRSAKENYPNALVVSGLEDIIDQIDAALVVTPTSSHFEICKKLIEHNKHVFCEKPFTATLEEALFLKDLAKGKNIIIQVGHSERFHEIWNKKEIFPEFFKGPSFVKIERCAPFKGRATDVSVVSDLMIHDLDIIKYLFDESPRSLEATGYKIRTNEYDYVNASLKYKSGLNVFIINSRNDTFEKRNLTIVNKHGTLFFDLLNFEFSFADGKETKSDKFVQKEVYNKRDHLLVEQECFYNSIISNSRPIVTLDDGVHAVRLISDIHKSLELEKSLIVENP